MKEVDLKTIPVFDIEPDETLARAVLIEEYRKIRSIYHDYYSRFHSMHKKYDELVRSLSHVISLSRIYENLTNMGFYYLGCTFDLKYDNGDVLLYLHCTPDFAEIPPKTACIKLCDFSDFTPEIFVNFVLYEKTTNKYKDLILDYE